MSRLNEDDAVAGGVDIVDHLAGELGQYGCAPTGYFVVVFGAHPAVNKSPSVMASYSAYIATHEFNAIRQAVAAIMELENTRVFSEMTIKPLEDGDGKR